MAIFRRGPPNVECRESSSNVGDYEKSQFSTNISLYLKNDTRQDYSYYETPIEMRFTE